MPDMKEPFIGFYTSHWGIGRAEADHEAESDISWSQLQLFSFDAPMWGEHDSVTHQPFKIWHLSISMYFTWGLGAISNHWKGGPEGMAREPSLEADPRRNGSAKLRKNDSSWAAGSDNATAAETATEPSLFGVKCHFFFFNVIFFYLHQKKNLASLIHFEPTRMWQMWIKKRGCDKGGWLDRNVNINW